MTHARTRNGTTTVARLHRDAEAAARTRQEQLTKPRGALGRLEEIACWFAARQGRVRPEPLRPHIVVFAADHGVCAEGVSAYPSVVTAEMVKNFVRGGAAINVLARQCGAALDVVDVGVATDLTGLEGIVHARVRPGTANLLHEAAMTPKEYAAALEAGRAGAQAAIDGGANLLIAGEMGIGNTTASACLICRLAGIAPEEVVGYGTGVDEAGRTRKIDVVGRALARIRELPDDRVPAEVGGLEIAAMTGFYLAAAQAGVPAVVDGFIAAAAALAARLTAPSVTDWLLASHCSEERGHRAALAALGLEPLVDFGMRLGEGTGAALAVPLLQAAIALHNEMATFADAGVTDKDG
ncbi:MAG: nicotinate-nucleotide--dimethylbenzimidazole phosphoribosyltransferase [Zetaproteobacteria bacterium]|nr:MAG: nicotinate-nucleotide--dimethylbenzimidazole phosphoribosyltransferase [Zetaproteobacteria bacterium]